jgi:hypothetical protein
MTRLALARGERPQDEVGKIEICPRLDQPEQARVDHIDPHGHCMLARRLFKVADDWPCWALRVTESEHTEVDRCVSLLRCNGECVAAPQMDVDESGIVESREDVPIHHQERLAQVADGGQSTRRAERGLLVVVVDPDAVRLPVAEEFRDACAMTRAR